MGKSVLTLDGILERYFYIQWVQDELRAVGEPTSGVKSQLIKRFLNSARIRDRPVDVIAVSLLTSLRVTDLRQIAADLGADTHGKHGQLLKRILSLVTFEPYVKRVTRPCTVCLRDTRHELHFGIDWQADNFRCEVCGTTISVRSIKNEAQSAEPVPQQVFDTQFVESTVIPESASKDGKGGLSSQNHRLAESAEVVGASIKSCEEDHDSVSNEALAWTVASVGVGVFLTVTMSVGLTYGWWIGVVIGVVATVLAGVILIPTRRRWMRVLLRMVK